jgi:hypothetical protein
MVMIVNKLKLFYNLKKEEKWLNDMLEEGYILSKKSISYKFEKCMTKGMIRVDFRSFSKQKDFVDYQLMFEDSGWQHIVGSKSSGTQYFYNTDESDTEIFSDELSQLGMLKRRARYWVIFSIVMSILLTQATFGQIFVMPKAFYLTPDLWSMSGKMFWLAFWFETPFALSRFMMTYGIFGTLSIFALHAYYRAKKAYKRNNI